MEGRNKIVFDYELCKLWGQTSAVLVAVRRIWLENVPAVFVEYDCRMATGELYRLEGGECLQLVFVGNYGIPFCTVRRNEEGKELFYKSLLNRQFDIVIKNKAKLHLPSWFNLGYRLIWAFNKRRYPVDDYYSGSFIHSEFDIAGDDRRADDEE